MAKLLGLHSLDGVFAAIKAAIAAKSEINDVSATITTDSSGVAKADAIWNDGNLAFVFTNIKGDPLTFDELTTEQKAELRGATGAQGATGVYDSSTQDFLTTLETTMGNSQTKTMTQNAITKELLPIQDGNRTFYALLTGYCIGGQGTVYTNAFTTNYGVTDYLMLDEGQTKVKIVSGAWQRAATDRVIYFYSDTDEEHKITGEKLGDASTEAINAEFIVPSNAKYYRLTIKHATPAIVQMKGSLVDKIDRICDVDVTPLALTKNNGYINTSGNIASASQDKFYYTDPIAVSAGTILQIKIASSTSMALLSKYGNGTYTPLIIGSGTDIRNVTYIVDEVMDVVFSGFSNKWNNTEVVAVNVNGGLVKEVMDGLDLNNTNGVVRKVKDGIISYDEALLELDQNNGYVSSAGKVLSSGSDQFFNTSPIQVYAGDVVDFYGSSSAAMSAISEYDDGAYTPLVLGRGTGLKHYSYFAEKDMYVVFSGYSNKLGESWARRQYNISGDVKTLVEANVDMLEKKIEVLNPNKGFNPISIFNNIVAVGDSLTFCQVYTSSESSRRAYRPWPEQIRGEFGLSECLSFAVGGWKPSSVWNALSDPNTTHSLGPLRVPETGKTIVFIYLGTNGYVCDEELEDISLDDVATYETSWPNNETGYYCKIIQRFLNLGAKIVLIIPRGGGTGADSPEGWTLEDTRRSVVAVAEMFGLAYVDALECHTTDSLYHKWPDGQGQNSLHYNDFGYAYFKERLVEQMASLPESLMQRLLPL